MENLRDLLSRKLSDREIRVFFGGFGYCDFCDRKGHACRYRDYDCAGRYIEGLICDLCYLAKLN